MAGAAVGAQILGEVDNRLGSMLQAGGELRNSELRQALYEQNAANMASAVQADADTNRFSSQTAGAVAEAQAGAAQFSGAGFEQHMSSAMSNISAARESNINNLQERGNQALKNVLNVNAANNAAADSDATQRLNHAKMMTAGGGIFGSVIAGLMMATKGAKTSFDKAKIPDKPGVIYANQVYMDTGVVGGRRANPSNQGGTAYINRTIQSTNELFHDAMSADEATEWEATRPEEVPTVDNTQDPSGQEEMQNWNDFSNWFHADSVTGVPFGTAQNAWDFHNPETASQFSADSMPAGAEASSMVGRPGWFNVSPAVSGYNMDLQRTPSSATSSQYTADTNNLQAIGDGTSQTAITTQSSIADSNASIGSPSLSLD